MANEDLKAMVNTIEAGIQDALVEHIGDMAMRSPAVSLAQKVEELMTAYSTVVADLADIETTLVGATLDASTDAFVRKVLSWASEDLKADNIAIIIQAVPALKSALDDILALP